MLAPLVFAADDNYAMPVSVAARSAALHGALRTPIFILDGGFSEASKELVHRSVSGVGGQVRFLSAAPTRGSVSGALPHISAATYLRFQVQDLLPEFTRAIYADADTLVVDSLEPLTEVGLNDLALAGVHDGTHPNGHAQIWQQGFSPSSRYFNAGVLLLNLELLRSQVGLAKSLDEQARTGRFHFVDQDILNLRFENRWQQVDDRWNFRCDGLGLGISQRPALLHYMGELKPWHIDADLLEHRSAWLEIARQTPWPASSLQQEKGTFDRLAKKLSMLLMRVALAHRGFDRKKFLTDLEAALRGHRPSSAAILWPRHDASLEVVFEGVRDCLATRLAAAERNREIEFDRAAFTAQLLSDARVRR